jgi:hypothetical protein
MATLLALLAACAPRYEYRAIPVRQMGDYPGQASLPGLNVGAVAFYDSQELTTLFGFDLKKAGVVPVQIAIQNTGASDVTALAGSTVTDEAGLVWEVLPSDEVFRRVDNYTGGSLSADQGVKRAALWGLAGAIVGAAVGVVSGSDVASSAGKGAAVGVAAGASSAILGIGPQEDESGNIVRDFSSRSLDHRAVAPGQSVHGFLYFPAESKRPRRLSLNISVDGHPQTLSLAL